MTAVRSVCVFCGSSPGADPAYMAAAREFGTILGKSGIRLVFGGGMVGLMGAVAESCLAAGGLVTGIIPEILKRVEIAYGGLSELIVVPDMHTRKRMMFDRSDAFCVLPGGLGTLDEIFEILTWRGLGLHERPVAFCDIAGYWQPMVDMVNAMARDGFVRPGALDHFGVVSTAADVLPFLNAHAGSAASKADLF